MCLLGDSVKGCKQGRSEALFSGLAGLGISVSGVVLGPAPCGWVWAGAGCLWVLMGLCQATCSAVQEDH